jgi:hypothetical protein
MALSQEAPLGQARIGHIFDLLLQNQSDEPIWVAWDQNPRVFVYSADAHDWVEVPDRVVHMSEGELLDARGQGLWAIILGIKPLLGVADAPVEVRVVVTGQVVSRGTPAAEQVGAYLDVVLEP